MRVLFSDTCTIFHRVLDKKTKEYIYIPFTIKDVHYSGKQSATFYENKGVYSNNEIKIYIPLTSVGADFEISIEDKIAKGVCDDVSKAFTIISLQLYNQSFYSPHLRHWAVIAK